MRRSPGQRMVPLWWEEHRLSQLDRGLDRRRALKLLATLGAAGAAAPVLSACSSSTGTDKMVDEPPIRLGLLIPQSGVYKTIGDDLSNGFQMFIKLNGNKLGGRGVDLVFADEGETAESGKAAAAKLLKQDRVTALSGVVNSAVMNAIKDDVEAAQVPLIGSNASPTTLIGVKYIWRTSYVNDEPCRSLGAYVANRVGDGSVYLMCADYQEVYSLVPTTYAMPSYDAAAVLDKAITIAGAGLTSQTLNAAIGRIGSIDSPRGPWQFNQTRTPLQKWYLRQVRLDGAVLSNGVISELVTLAGCTRRYCRSGPCGPGPARSARPWVGWRWSSP